MLYDRIKISLTPRHNASRYGDLVDITQNVDITDLVHRNIGTIQQELDAGDYDIGIFTFGALSLKCYNDQGFFSDVYDWRSLFPYKRDMARVKIEYIHRDNSSDLIFEGLINDDATRDEDGPELDLKAQSVRFKVLSLESVFRHVKVAGGAVGSGVLISTAIKQILNTTAIKSVLNFDPDTITVAHDFQIDDGEHFSGLSVKEALDDLLNASASILYIRDDHTIVVAPRIENPQRYYLYGPHDPLGRSNIIEIEAFNNGLQRAFSAIEVNESEAVSEAYVSEYGYRKKSFSFDFITDAVKAENAAQHILDEFKVPRFECKVEVPYVDVRGIRLLDQVVIDHPLKFSPGQTGTAIPTIDTLVIGESYVPKVSGVLRVRPHILWKVIGIDHDMKKFVTKLKLRQTGTRSGEGVIAP